MKVNITKDNAKFIINKDARKVICIIDQTSFLFVHYAEKNLKIPPDCDNIWGGSSSSLYPKLKMPNKFIGIATCSPEDEWNEEIGRMLAFSRATDNLNKAFFKRANIYINTLDNWITDAVENINNYGAKIEVNTKRRHNKIEEILK